VNESRSTSTTAKNYAIEITTKTPDSGRDLAPKSWFEKMLRRFLPNKEIGWQDIGEVFYRYQLIKCRWFNLYLHQLDAPAWHPVGCHDHPWWFITVLLKGGYLEKQSSNAAARDGAEFVVKRRYPGQILYRPAEHAHDVITPYGRSWSLVLTGRKAHTWGFLKCEA
jgi:hypothetical protein